jgi:hypothetical protein
MTKIVMGKVVDLSCQYANFQSRKEVGETKLFRLVITQALSNVPLFTSR